VKLFKQLMADTRGLAGVELGLLLVFVAVGIMGAVIGMGANVTAKFEDMGAKYTAANNL
jgi:Flp pilus assembly pilin Flp